MISSDEIVVTGGGSPITVFAHGLGSSITHTRPFGSGVDGRRAFFPFRGHGSDLGPAHDGPWSYAELAADLAEVADRTRATRAVGISLGAGALLRLLVVHPDLFERVVVCLPAVLDRRDDRADERFARLAELARVDDRAGLTRMLLAEQPAEVRSQPSVLAWASEQVDLLTRSDLVRGLTELPVLRPIEDRAELAALGVPMLIVAASGDPAHPVSVAEELAAALPYARLEVFGAGGLLWKHRADVRTTISGFLNAECV